MTKLYQKSEITFAILWIVIYAVGMEKDPAGRGRGKGQLYLCRSSVRTGR